MARQPAPDGRRVHVNVKFSESEAAEIDAARGTAGRRAWLRDAALSAARDLTMTPQVAASSLAEVLAESVGAETDVMETVAGGAAFISEYGGTRLVVVVTPQCEDGPLMTSGAA